MQYINLFIYQRPDQTKSVGGDVRSGRHVALSGANTDEIMRAQSIIASSVVSLDH